MRGALRLAVVVAALASPASAPAARTGILAGRILLPAHARGTTVTVLDPQSGRIRLEAAITGGRFRLRVPVGIVMVGVTTHGRLRTFVGHSRIMRLRAGRRVALRPIRLTKLKRLHGVVLPPVPPQRLPAARRATYIVYVRGVTQSQLGSDTALDWTQIVESDVFQLADGVGCAPHSMLVVSDPKGPFAAAALAEIRRSQSPAFDPRTRLRFNWPTPTHRISGALLESGPGQGVVDASIHTRRGRLIFSRTVATRAFGTAPEILARLAFYHLCPRRPPIEFDVRVKGSRDLSSDVGGQASMTWSTTLFLRPFGAPTMLPADETVWQRYEIEAGETTWTASGTVGACTLKGSGTDTFDAAQATTDSMLWYSLTLASDGVRHYRGLAATQDPVNATLTCPTQSPQQVPLWGGERALWWDTALDPGEIRDFPPGDDLLLIGHGETPAPVESWSWVAGGADG
jgi:hypothetical protein